MKVVLILIVAGFTGSAFANTSSLEAAFKSAVADSEKDKSASLKTISLEDESRMAEWHKSQPHTIEVQATAGVDAPSKAQPIYLEDESHVDAEMPLKDELKGVN